jgi:ferric-dicitrate binding protein FerR (iron transport regulator)
MMDDSELMHEVLELALACQDRCAGPEERARLERLLADHPQAIVWYLRIVDDTLTLMDAAAAHESAHAPFTGTIEPTMTAARQASPECMGAESSAGHNKSRRWLAAAALACTLLIAVTASLWRPWQPWFAHTASGAEADVARVVNVANVEWQEGAERFDEWALVKPGEALKFRSGWINLFLPGGAELLIEGPADVEYVSSQKVVARQGKLAARVGPGAVGFEIDTPHAKLIDRGTSFGVTVDGRSHTSVVVYEGTVDLNLPGDEGRRPRRLVRGEALSVDGQGKLSRITTVHGEEFLEPPQVRHAGSAQSSAISQVSDNIRSLETAKYNRIIPQGFREDCRAYVDRFHEWNGVDARGLPPFLVGGDYIMTFNDDKVVSAIEIAVTLSQPGNLYILIDDRVTPPDWLKRDFVDTNWDVGCDEGWPDRVIDLAVGPGQSVEHVFSVWRRVVAKPTTVILGALSYESPPPPVEVERSMYGIVVTPLSISDTDGVAEP